MRPARLRPERPGYVPWPHPAAVGMAWGIVVAGSGIGIGWLAPTLLACAWRLMPGVIVVICALFGWAAMERWEARPDPLAGRYGDHGVFTGRSDGRVLHLDVPKGARAALAPAGLVPAGRVAVRGTLERPADRRNPGGFDYRGYLRRRGVTGQLYVEELVGHVPAPGLRGRMRRALDRGMPPQASALVAAMTLGVRDDLGELRDIFAAAGLAHVLALSGLHVGVLVAALMLLTRRCGRVRYPLVLAALAGYVALVGPSPSVVRAAGMVGAAVAVRAYGGGRVEPWTALALAAVATLARHPAWLFDVSFQLSYLAVIGLLVFGGPFLRAVRANGAPWWHPRVLGPGAVAVSIASQVPMGSLLMATFGTVPILSPPANVLAIPLATALVPLGLVAAASGALWGPLAALVNLAVRPLAGVLIAIAELASRWPALPWGEIGPAGHAVYGLAVVALGLLVHGRLQLRRALLVWITAGAYAAIPPVLPQVLFLDVGQGDAVLVRLPGRREVLIDGGGTPFGDFDVGAEVIVPALRALGVDELELVVATHADADHMEGLASVLRIVPVHQVAVGVAADGVAVFDALVRSAREAGTGMRSVRRGEVISLGDAAFEVLNPPARPPDASNEGSVALLFRWRDHPVALFLGDVSSAVERDLAFPAVPLLMVPHHGSRFSTSEHLVRAAQPKRAVVSVGENRFGHPAEEVLQRLAAYGVDVLSTRTHGFVRVSVPDLLRP